MLDTVSRVPFSAISKKITQLNKVGQISNWKDAYKNECFKSYDVV